VFAFDGFTSFMYSICFIRHIYPRKKEDKKGLYEQPQYV
jgi:hypothetical protein